MVTHTYLYSLNYMTLLGIHSNDLFFFFICMRGWMGLYKQFFPRSVYDEDLYGKEFGIKIG